MLYIEIFKSNNRPCRGKFPTEKKYNLNEVTSLFLVSVKDSTEKVIAMFVMIQIQIQMSTIPMFL